MKITVVHNDTWDWCGIYVDGTLFREGHSLNEIDGLDASGILYTYIHNYKMDESGVLPYEEASL